MKLTNPQRHLLFKAWRKIGWFTTLHPSECLAAQALERKGLATYRRNIDEGTVMRLTREGAELALNLDRSGDR